MRKRPLPQSWRIFAVGGSTRLLRIARRVHAAKSPATGGGLLHGWRRDVQLGERRGLLADALAQARLDATALLDGALDEPDPADPGHSGRELHGCRVAED